MPDYPLESPIKLELQLKSLGHYRDSDYVNVDLLGSMHLVEG